MTRADAVSEAKTDRLKTSQIKASRPMNSKHNAFHQKRQPPLTYRRKLWRLQAELFPASRSGKYCGTTAICASIRRVARGVNSKGEYYDQFATA